MPDKDNKNTTATTRNISEDERFKYIGFEVYPGKPKDLFKSETEKKKWVDSVLEKRKKGAKIREECTLLESRVSLIDKVVLVLASAIIIATLFMPWFSVYNQIEETVSAEPITADSTMLGAAVSDSLADSLAAMVDTMAEPAMAAAEQQGTTADTTGASSAEGNPAVGSQKASPSEEILHSYVAKKKYYKEYARISALGAITSLGSIGSYVFSSGFALMLTAILFIVYILLCAALPIYTLVGLFGGKGNSDEQAIRLKKILRYNWIPLIIFVAGLVLSFFGSGYNFEASSLYSSLGDSYGPGVYLDSISWGIIVSLAAFILMASKGSEI